ncbi:MAG: protein kinase [Planctomycetes bacterium]|nr:protein kinase [Planctomycetota bacterium]
MVAILDQTYASPDGSIAPLDPFGRRLAPAWCRIMLKKPRELFEHALTLTPEERPEFLQRECADAPDLLDRVLGMLAADARASGSTSALTTCRAALGAPPVDESLLKTLELPRYRILEVIGRGGMSVVCKAEQTDLHRHVALKLVFSFGATEEFLARLTREGELLARIDHPGVVRVIESGRARLADFEIPFLALELVQDGRPLTTYAADEQLDVRQRCELMHKVCEAVAAGHRANVIHRDLKPTNLLVDGDARVRVIDFGIGRVLDEEEQRSGVTRTGQVLGTVRYMSPEQLAGGSRRLDARTDVWSLGLVAFELLTREHPFGMTTETSPASVAHRIATQEPRSLASYGKHLRGDLDILVQRCLAKDPNDRYRDAGELAGEFARFLAGQPIEARREHRLYLLRKTVRRHRLLLIILGIGFAAALGLAIALGSLLAEARESRRDAERNFEQAEHNLYRSRVAQAGLALLDHRITEARDVLLACREEDRDWEWRHLMARTDDSVFTLQHGNTAIDAIAISADGTRLATGGRDRSILVWDLAQRRVVHRLAGHAHDVRGLVFLGHGDEQLLASASYDRTVRVWNVEEEREIRRFVGAREYWSLVATRDGKRLVGGDQGGTVTVWNTDDDSEERSWKAHETIVGCLALTADDARLATGSYDKTIAVWGLATGKRVHHIRRSASLGTDWIRNVDAHGGPVTSVAFHAIPFYLVSTCEDGYGKLWDLRTGTLDKYEYFRSRLIDVALAPDGNTLALATSTNVELRGALDALVLDPLRGNRHQPRCLAFTPDARSLAVADAGGFVKVYELDRRSGSILYANNATPFPELAGIRIWGIAAANGVLVFVDERGTLQIWSLETNQPESKIDKAHSQRIRDVSISEDGTWVATTGDDQKMRLWRRGEKDPVAERTSPPSSLARLDRFWLLAGSTPQLRAVHLETLEDAWTLETGDPKVGVLDVAPDGQSFTTGSSEGWIRRWDAHTLEPIAAWKGHPGPITALHSLRDGSIISCGKDDSMYVWSAPGVASGIAATGMESIIAIAATEDEKRLILLPMRGNPRVIDRTTCETLTELYGHEPIAILTDIVRVGKDRFFTSDSQGHLRLWSPTSLTRGEK